MKYFTVKHLDKEPDSMMPGYSGIYAMSGSFYRPEEGPLFESEAEALANRKTVTDDLVDVYAVVRVGTYRAITEYEEAPSESHV